jgi:hypothetical protein
MNILECNGNDHICLPRKTFIDRVMAFEKMEGLMATADILADKETMGGLKESKEDLKRGRFIECKPACRKLVCIRGFRLNLYMNNIYYGSSCAQRNLKKV